MRSAEAHKWVNLAPGTFDASNENNSGGAPKKASGPITLQGGTYQLVIHCTGTPAMALQQLGADGVTWVAMYVVPDDAPATPINSVITSDKFYKATVPPGAYRIVVATSTANFVSLTRIPTSE